MRLFFTTILTQKALSYGVEVSRRNKSTIISKHRQVFCAFFVSLHTNKIDAR